MRFSSIENAVKSLQRGRFIIIVDDEHRENEGDLAIAAEKVTPSKINYMIRHGRGLICMPIAGSRLDELKLPLMVPEEKNTEVTRCAFTIPVDVKNGTTTGISAFDRAATIEAMISSKTKPSDLLRPGHLFPIRYNEGGVLARPGHTEAVVDLCKLAELYPAGVICEILNDDGTMAKLEQLFAFAEKRQLDIVTIKELLSYLAQKHSIQKNSH